MKPRRAKRTYEDSGVSKKASKSDEEFIYSINRFTRELPKQEYVIGGIGGFAGLFDLSAFLDDEEKKEAATRRRR